MAKMSIHQTAQPQHRLVPTTAAPEKVHLMFECTGEFSLQIVRLIASFGDQRIHERLRWCDANQHLNTRPLTPLPHRKPQNLCAVGIGLTRHVMAFVPR
jgi:hypothetical protein